MRKKTELIPVRLSHLLRHCSVGAIVRGPDYLMTVKDIREWVDPQGNPPGEPLRYVDRVRGALGIHQALREPPIAREMSRGRMEGTCVPALRFPFWMRCLNPACGLLYYQPWRHLDDDEKPHCHLCQQHAILEQVPWILVHMEGHMADVPWHFLAHANARHPAQKQCKQDHQRPYLRLREQKGSQRRLRCERCGAENLFSTAIPIAFGTGQCQPWCHEHATVTPHPESGEARAEIVEINDVRVHSPVTRTALVVPPESRVRRGSVIDRLYRSSQKLRLLHQARTPLARKSALQQIASAFRCPVAAIEEALQMIEQGYPGHDEQEVPDQLLGSEYLAFLHEWPDMAEDEDFVTQHHTRAWKSLAIHFHASTRSHRIIAAVDHLVAVNRLREIMVLKGFNRLGGDTLVPPDIVGKSDWLPALELYGEGVFFVIHEPLLRAWESTPIVKERADSFYHRFEAAALCNDPELEITPRFLLLHTLAHLLIRQMETQAGYPAASLKERIYCAVGKPPMSGILVYIAVPDILGSLGGLAELAAPSRFLPLLVGAFDHADWCSLDPVCSKQEGQGPGLLNRAACHACALIPESSCAFGNVLLDRLFIKGNAKAGMSALLETVLPDPMVNPL